MALGPLEKLAAKKDIELLIVLPGGQTEDGTFTDITVSALTSDGVQHDFELTSRDIKQKSRLRKLYRFLRKQGTMMLDDYAIVVPRIGTPGAPGSAGLPEAA